MSFTKKIEKIQPIILLSFFLIFISSAVPLIYLVPLNNTSASFSNQDISGDVSYNLQGQKLIASINISYIKANHFVNDSLNLITRISLNKVQDFVFSKLVYSNYSSQLRVSQNLVIILPESIVYSLSYVSNMDLFLQNITSSINSISSAPVGTVISTFGRFNLPLYEKWFLLTFISSASMYLGAIFILKKRRNISYLGILNGYVHNSYESYNQVLSNLNENYYSVLLLTPIFALISIFVQIYIHFSLIFSVTLIFSSLKTGLFSFIFIYNLLILFSPAVLNFIFDQFHKQEMIHKTRITNSLIFSPIFVVYYFVLFLLILVSPSKEIFILAIFTSTILQITIFFISLRYHCSKYELQTNYKQIVKYAIIFKLFLLILIYFFIQFILTSNMIIPSYLFLF